MKEVPCALDVHTLKDLGIEGDWGRGGSVDDDGWADLVNEWYKCGAIEDVARIV